MYGKIVILSVPDSEDYILKKILKVVERSTDDIDIEEREFPSETMERGELQISFSEKKVYQNGQEILLNRHEYDTLVYLARHPGWVRSKEQVVDYENAVMWCISQLRKKLEPDPDRLQYIHTVKGVGYKFEYRKNKN